MAKIQLQGILQILDVQINPRVFKKISQATAGLPQSLGKASKSAGELNTQMTDVGRSTKRVATNLSQSEIFAKRFVQRMAQFAILLPIFATLNRSIQGGVKFLVDFETQLKNIQRIDIAGLSDRMDEVAEAALRTARELGGTAEAVIDTTRVFKQAGLSIEDSQERARVAVLATKISTLTLVQAQEILIGATRQFSSANLTAEQILDKFARTEDVAATSAQDLADALRTGGNALAFFTKGNLDSTVGLIAALREQTRKSGREIGTFFKTFATRVTAAGDARDALEQLGVAVEDVSGNLRPGLDIINDLAVAFDGLGEAEKATAAKAIAGVRQFESLLGVLESVDRANEITAQSTNSAGTALRQYEVVQDSLAIKTEKAINGFKELAFTLGEAGLLDIFKNLVDFGGGVASALKAVTGETGGLASTILPLLGVGAIKVGAKAFGLGGAGGRLGATSAQTAATTKLTAAITAHTAAVSTDTTALARHSDSLIVTTSSFHRQSQAIIGSQRQQSRLSRVTGAAVEKSKALLRSQGGLLVASLAVDASFRALAGGLGTLDEDLGNTAGNVGSALTTGLQFAMINPMAGLVAGLGSIIISSGADIKNAIDDEIKARKDLAELRQAEQGRNLAIRISEFDPIITQAAVEFGKALDSQGGEFNNKARDAGNAAFRALVGALPAEDELQRDIKAKLGTVNFSDIVTNLDVITNLADRLNLEDTSRFIEEAGDNIKSMQTPLRAVFFEELRALGGQLTTTSERTRNFFESLESVAALERLITADRQAAEARQRLTQASDDSIPIFESTTESLMRRMEAEESLASVAQQNLNLLREQARITPGALGFVGNRGDAGEKAEAFINKLVEFVRVGADGEEVLQALATEIGTNTARRELARKVISAATAALEDEADARELARELTNEQAKVEIELNKVRQQAVDDLQANIDAERRALFDLGATSAASAEDVEALKDLTLESYKAILAGAEGFSENVRGIVLTLGGTEVQQAQNDLDSALAKTAFNVEVLEGQMLKLAEQLASFDGDVDPRSGEARLDLLKKQNQLQAQLDKERVDGEVENIKRRGALLQAQVKAEEEAAEEARKLQEALEKLADAEQKLERELEDGALAFAKFADSKFEDFAKDLADAQSNLADAELAVLEANGELEASYEDLFDAILNFNDAITTARIEANLIGIEIQSLGGGLNDFQGRLAAINNAFTSVLNESNISLKTRIDLERQLATETLDFLRQTRDEIVSAGLQVFGQTGEQNRDLQLGVEGLRFVAEKLGGSFDSFKNLTKEQFDAVSRELLALPADLRQKILDALGTLPSTVDVGGFSPEELEQALGQIGAGISPEEGLPSIEELLSKEAEQLQKLQELAIRSAELEVAGVIAAQQAVEIAQAELEEAELLRERAEEELLNVQQAIIEETAVLEEANALREALTDQVIAATDKAAIDQITAEAREFGLLRGEIGAKLSEVVSAIAGIQLQVIQAAGDVPNAARGYIPNFARGSLTNGEVTGLIRAAQREKAMMPAGGRLAVANTTETIIPNRAKGQEIPNFQSGSAINAGIESARGLNETIVAAIARSIAQTTRGVQGQAVEADPRVIDLLRAIQDQMSDLNDSNTAISDSVATAGDDGDTTTAAPQRVEIAVTTNQQNSVRVNGLDGLASALEDALRSTTDDQIRQAVQPLVEQIQILVGNGIETGQLTSFGQGRA